MLKVERRLLQTVQRKIIPIAFFVGVLLSIIIRFFFMNYISLDMETFLIPWSEQLKAEGFSSFLNGVGNYNSPYLLLLFLGTKLRIKSLYIIKIYSIIGDYVLAAGMAMLVFTLRTNDSKKSRVHWAGATFLFFSLFPLILINSAYWGQCDSIYGAFAVWSLYCLLKERYGLSFIWLAIGFCFKLQIIFLLPLYIIIYFTNKKFSIAWFLTIPFALLLTGIPSAIQGGSIMFGYKVYFGQTGLSDELFFNYPNITAFIRGANPEFFSKPLMIMTLIFFMIILTWLLIVKANVKGDSLILLGAICVLGAANLLPYMHERYGFLGELLLWTWFLVNPNMKRLIPALVFTYTGFAGYGAFLFGFWQLKEPVLAAMNLITLGYLVWRLMVEVPKQTIDNNPVEMNSVIKNKA